jgi:tRNA-splicing ligase RtcB
MRANVRIFATQHILHDCLSDLSVDQAVNAACLPGLVGEVLVMPDVHQGYGFPIGGVAATDAHRGVVSPGAIGYDINCGVRLLASQVESSAVRPYVEELLHAFYAAIPTGLGQGGLQGIDEKELIKILEQGSQWALHRGYADSQDLQATEDGGRMPGADSRTVSERAIKRGHQQVGSLGAGNHFIEMSVVEEIFHPAAAASMGLMEGCVCLMLHSGSRGLGHQICSDYVQQYQAAQAEFKFSLPDRELVCAPIESKQGQAYLGAMACAANYAFCNRQVMAHQAQQIFERTLAGKCRQPYLHMVYDLAHNIGRFEKHHLGNTDKEVFIHRKGATRAFGPGQPHLPARYQKIGQPVLIPGSMGTASWVLLGTETAMLRSLGSACHGAGRLHSRRSARKMMHADQLMRSLHARGIAVVAGSMKGLVEEAPQAYKDVDEVVECVVAAGIVAKVARLRPLAVIKG